MHEALAKANFDRDLSALSEVSVRRSGLLVHAREFPIFDATIEHSRPVRLRFHCDNWDDLPPSIKILNPDGTPWSGALPDCGSRFNGNFICMPGSREYHGPPGNHTTDLWDNYKGQSGMELVGIMLQLAHAWRKGA